MYCVGITGGIGAGKSMVCRVFEHVLGIPVYNADERARWLSNHDPILKADISRLLGSEAYDVQGRYNRTWVAMQVFENPNLLTKLNSLIHPRVLADYRRWTTEQQNVPYVIKEAALIPHADPANRIDTLVVVEAPVALRIARIRQRDPHRSDHEISAIINRQATDADRRKTADYVILNDEKQLVLPQVWALHRQWAGVIPAV